MVHCHVHESRTLGCVVFLNYMATGKCPGRRSPNAAWACVTEGQPSRGLVNSIK